MKLVRSQSEQIAQLYDTYGDMQFRLAYSILLNQADAEDAVQDRIPTHTLFLTKCGSIR